MSLVVLPITNLRALFIYKFGEQVGGEVVHQNLGAPGKHIAMNT